MLYRDHIFGFDIKQLQSSAHRPSRGAFRCLDWAKGKVCWSTERVGQASVLAADNKLFLFNDSGDLILARADWSAFQELARVSLFTDEICWTPPSLSEGRLLVRSPSRLVCLFVGRSETMPENLSMASIVSPARRWRMDAGWLLSRERDYPNDAPTLTEMETWFVACLGCLLVAGLVGSLASGLIQRLTGKNLWLPLFLLLSFLAGLLGPNLLSEVADRCLFTWPVCLYAAFHAAMWTYMSAGMAAANRLSIWVARSSLVAFLLTIWGYFTICKWTGMFIGWSFLLGFVPAFPLTAVACRLQARRGSSLAGTICTAMAFSVFFWSCQLVFWWRAR